LPFVSRRFFFNLVSDTETITDEEGIVLSSEGDVLSHIAQALSDLQRDGPLDPDEWQGWQMVVTDSSGRELLRFVIGNAGPDCIRSSLN